MNMPGLIRRKRVQTCRFVVLPGNSPSLCLPQGTARPGPDVHHSGPGPFLVSKWSEIFSALPNSVPKRRTLAAYLTSLERKPYPGEARSNLHE
jgi:hypothetical protein